MGELPPELPKDALGYQPKPRTSVFDYTPGNLQMMKEYGMSEAEFAEEFGGRPHQQRQSPVSKTDLKRLRIPLNQWDYCSHKYIPLYLCSQSRGHVYSGVSQCKHETHEYEMCVAAEVVRQNQVLQIKKATHITYTNDEKNWLYNDPNFGHLLWRSKYGPSSFKAKLMMGGGTRVADPPTHEMTMEQNPKYNPDVVRADPHPWWWYNKLGMGQGLGFKFYWNRNAVTSPLYSGHKQAPENVVPFDPLQDGAVKKPW